jgi:hypothetical protein
VEQKRFTPEALWALKGNPYVERVSETTITYTMDFRERFALEYTSGKAPSVILRECGFDPATLGRRRLDGLVRRTKKYIQRPEGFSDTRKENSGRRRIKEHEEPTDAEKIRRLKHQVKYLKQENEFLKKIRLLDWQAELECKRKQSRKKSTKSSKK